MIKKNNLTTKISISLILFFSIFILKYLPYDNYVISPVNILAKFKGFELKNSNIASFERSDVIDSSIPNHFSYCRAWNDDHDSIIGWDFTLNAKIVNFYSGKFNPLTIIPCFFDDFAEGMDAYYFLKTFLFSLGMFLFFRIYFDDFTSLIGVFASVGSSFFSGWIFWNHTLVLCFLPWVLWSVRNIFFKGEYVLYFFIYFISLYLLISSGFFFIIFISLIVVGIYFFIIILSLKKKEKQIINFRFIIFSFLSLILAIFLLLNIMPLLNTFTNSGYISLRSENFSFLIPIKEFIKLNFVNAYENINLEGSLYFGFFLIYLFPFFFIGKKRNIELILFSISIIILLFLIFFENYLSKKLMNLKVFSSNDIRRASFLFIFSFLPLALISIENIKNFLFIKNKFISIFFASIFFIFSFYDSVNYFSKFNKPSLKKNFFSKTEAIDYLEQNTSVFEYTLPDYNFYFNGTLRYFGINDIYSHRIRSKKYNDYLSHINKYHQSSFTSSKIDFFKINFFSPLMHIYNIKYVITDNYNKINNKILYENLFENDIGIKTLDKKVELDLLLKNKQALSGIQLFFLTYHKRIKDNIVLQFKDINGYIIFEKKFYDLELYDNQPIMLNFNELLYLNKGKYKLIISTSKKNNIAIKYKTNSFENQNLDILNSESLEVRFFTNFPKKKSKYLLDTYSTVFANKNVSIIKNKKAIGQYYFIDTKTFNKNKNIIKSDSFMNFFKDKNNKILIKNNYEFTIFVNNKYRSNNYYLILPTFKNDFDWSVLDNNNNKINVDEFQKIVAIKMRNNLDKIKFILNK